MRPASTAGEVPAGTAARQGDGMPIRRSIALALAPALLVVGCSGGPAPSAPRSAPVAPPTVATAAGSPTPRADLAELVRTGPAAGAWVGLNLDWGSETVAQVTERLGRPPATVVSFVPFPLDETASTNLDAAAGQARDVGAVLIVTLEPFDGLDAVTDDVAAGLARRLAAYGAAGTPTLVRFAHEMNGSWYPWGQDPEHYVPTFRRVAAAVHAGAPTAAMLWAPNEGLGYPYAGERYDAPVGSTARTALDTTGDGKLDAADDPYAPYWPGDDAVDWVGMSLYHWGTEWPWGENEVPAAGKFAALLGGSAAPAGTRTPDFYATWAEGHAKPLAIAETAAFYRPGTGGATEREIKLAWLEQALDPAMLARYPRLRLVNWFEWRKVEPEVNDTVDWRITADPELRAAFVRAASEAFTLGPAIR